jgi:hypothetical protein
MTLTRTSFRTVALALILLTPAVLTAQIATAPISEINPKLLSELKDSLNNTTAITLVEVDGTHLRGTVTDLTPDHVSMTVKFGTPSIYVPYRQIAKVDHPLLSRRGKIILGIVIAVSIVLIVYLAVSGSKAAVDDSHLP